MHILIAEDDPAIAEVLTYTLRSGGYAVDCVHNGADADAALLTCDFDLLILDLGLPDMDGSSVCRQVRDRSGP